LERLQGGFFIGDRTYWRAGNGRGARNVQARIPVVYLTAEIEKAFEDLPSSSAR